MRRLLGVLRDDDGRRRLAPQPGLDRLARARRRRPGCRPARSSSRSTGEPRPLPPAVDLSAYRIVQEALTNALRHAGRRAASACACAYADDRLRPRGGRRRRRPGCGAAGVAGADTAGRRCASGSALFGGTLDVGPRPSGGWSSRSGCRPLPTRRPMSDAVTVRVLVADDQALVRAGFRMILEAQDDIEVVGEAADGARGGRRWRARSRPDVVLMDVRMPRHGRHRGDPRRSCAELPATRVLVLTTFDLDEYVYDALRAGASGFLLKDVGRDDLVAAVRVVARRRRAARPER